MTKKTWSARRHAASALGSYLVFLMRDPRDGCVIGAGSSRIRPPSSNDEPETYAQGVSLERIRSIQANGYDVDIVVVADGLTSPAEAERVRAAVLATSQATSVLAGNLVDPLRLQRADDAGPRNLAEIDPFTHPEVQDYLASTSLQIGRLSGQLAAAEQRLADTQPAGFTDADHRRRLEAFILDQTEQIAELTAALNRVRALRDMSGWASRINGGSATSGRILLSDLDQALAGAPAGDVLD
jgi:hypothetical protein